MNLLNSKSLHSLVERFLVLCRLAENFMTEKLLGRFFSDWRQKFLNYSNFSGIKRSFETFGVSCNAMQCH